MLDFQKKKRIRKILYSPFTLVFFCALALFLSKAAWNVHKKAELSAGNLEREKIELAKLVMREGNLASSIDYLKTEQGVESEIRTKFRAVKEGEMVAVIIDDKSSSSTLPIPNNKRGIFYRFFHWPQ